MKRLAIALGLAAVAFALGLGILRWQRPARYFQGLEWLARRFPAAHCSGVVGEGPLMIAHAGGAVGGLTYTNAREALDLSFASGCRLFELDFEWSEDGRLVLLHDWNATATRIFGSGFGGRWHSRDRFLRAPRLDGLTSLDLDALVVWLVQHPEATVVSDVKVDNPRALAVIMGRVPEAARRVIPQIYTFDEYEPVRQLGFDRIILTLYRSDAPDAQVLDFAARQTLWAVAMPAARATLGLPQALAAIGVPALVHTVNSPRHASYLGRIGVRGLYTDDLVGCGGAPW